MRLGVLGAGAVGVRALRQWLATPDVVDLVVADRVAQRAERVAASLAGRVRAAEPSQLAGLDAVVLALPSPHAGVAEEHLRAGTAVVSTSDDLRDVRELLALGPVAEAHGLPLVVGAGFMPGLTCLLARLAAKDFERVDEVHVAKHGTGGPACARQHHKALGSTAVGWDEDGWFDRPGGSGRELCWFPDPIGAVDCYRAGLGDPLLLVPAFSGVQRVSARVSATRRDRMSARLPMLWPTDPEGGMGAVRVEVRGERDGVRAIEVLGALDWPAVAAGAVAAVAALAVGRGRVTRSGSFGLADARVPAESLLADLSDRGLKAARFVGADSTLPP